MKKIITVLSLVLISLSAQAGPNTSSYSGGHDSLLFDGSGGNSNYFKETGNECLIKVLLVKGNVTGKVMKKEIISVCGELDTVITYEKKLLKEGDMVVAGQQISTESDKDFVIAQLADGENMFLGGERGAVVVKDFCKAPPNIYMTLEAGKLGIDWNPLMPKTITICTELACLRIKGTVISLEIVNDGDVVTSVLRVYEGTAVFGRNIDNAANKKQSQDKAEQMKKLSEDFKNGKISIVEFSEKMHELQQEVKESVSDNEITVSAGYLCRIIGAEDPSVPEAFDINENRWWENK